MQPWRHHSLVVAALIVVNVYETHSEVSRTVSRAPAGLAALYRDAAAYPEPTRSQTPSAIRDYVHQIINEATHAETLHQLPLALLATLTALVLLMIFAWDRPYLGEFGVDSEAYQIVCDQLTRSTS